MSMAQLRQARQALITHHLLAYRRPLYQVLALQTRAPTQDTGLEPHDDSADLQAVFQQIWEVLR